jgi:hypothetical protein
VSLTVSQKCWGLVRISPNVALLMIIRSLLGIFHRILLRSDSTTPLIYELDADRWIWRIRIMPGDSQRTAAQHINECHKYVSRKDQFQAGHTFLGCRNITQRIRSFKSWLSILRLRYWDATYGFGWNGVSHRGKCYYDLCECINRYTFRRSKFTP